MNVRYTVPLWSTKIFGSNTKQAKSKVDDDMRDNPSQVVHLNHAGASPTSDAVLRRVIHHLQQEQVLGGYAAKNQCVDELTSVYEKAAALIHASTPGEIALVESATVAWTRLFYSFAEYQEHHKETQEKIILVSEAEYAANLVAACQWARTHPGWSVLAIPSEKGKSGRNSTGKIDLSCLASILAGTYEVDGKEIDPRCIAIVCITHVPTNSGIVNPVEQIGTQIAKFNGSTNSIFYLVDACQSVGHIEISVQTIKCSGLVAMVPAASICEAHEERDFFTYEMKF